ncbi:MAG: hypothetical protein ACXAC7_23205 [Candidatus Hodarchaeales archaeon]
MHHVNNFINSAQGENSSVSDNEQEKEICDVCGKPSHFAYEFKQLNKTIHRCKDHEHID